MSLVNKTSVKLEICTDSVLSCLEAEKAGADRVELCAGLFEGGTTPSYGLIQLVRQQISINLHVLIRPRGGDFCYSDLEFEVMRRDLALIKEAGCDGVVIGILHPDGTIDKQRTAQLIAESRPMSVTFHRAFDMTPNAVEAIQDLIYLGVDRLLTSGQEKTALEGSELIKELIHLAGDKLIIMPGGGITDRNVARIQKETGAQEFHLSARKKVNSAMLYRNSRVSMGGEMRLPEYELAIADADRILNTLNALK